MSWEERFQHVKHSIRLFRNFNGRSFLHDIFRRSKNETLTILLKELGALKELLGQGFVNELILMKSRYIGVFLSLYACNSKHFSNDYFIGFLNQIKLLCDQETLRKFFLAVDKYSRTFLHICCYYTKDFDLQQVLEWVARELGKEVLTELILLRDWWDQTIFHRFTSPSNDKQSNCGSKLLSILGFLKNDLKFDSDFLIKINFKLTVLFLNFGFSNLLISTIFIALYQLY
jgi:hypothetical protein